MGPAGLLQAGVLESRSAPHISHSPWTSSLAGARLFYLSILPVIIAKIQEEQVETQSAS